MNKRFQDATLKMSSILQQLLAQPTVSKDDIGITPIPSKGVYVFFENNKAIYVGRSNRLKERLKEHSSVSSDHYSASLAFRIAKQKWFDLQPEPRRLTNQQLMGNNDFREEFEKAKNRIAKTKIRFIPIEDQIEQALFEIYAHLELKTEYNDFKTH